MNIILFGGSFDPPHKAHQHITKTILDQNIFDEVWYLPVHIHDFDKSPVSPQHRLAMLRQILIDNTKIETYEIDRGGVSYTHDTLLALSKKNPQHTFSFLIGSDNLEKFHLWGCSRHNSCYTTMLRDFPFYVYPRRGYPFSPLYKGMIPLQDFDQVEVSSTEIRDRVKQKKPISHLVDKRVEEYIKENELYGGKK